MLWGLFRRVSIEFSGRLPQQSLCELVDVRVSGLKFTMRAGFAGFVHTLSMIFMVGTKTKLKIKTNTKVKTKIQEVPRRSW